MKKEYQVIGHFKYMDETASAIKELKAGNVSDFEYFSPFPSHDLDDAMYEGESRSEVKYFTLFGGLLGCLGAFLMATWMSIDYPIRTSAKPVLSFPAFIVIAFECTILIGAISTLVGMFHNSKIPNFFRMTGYRPQFSEGTFGICVRVSKDESGQMAEKLRALGADEVEEQYAR